MNKRFLTGFAMMHLAADAASQGGNSNELTKEQVKQIIESRKIVTEPGQYQAKVTNVTLYTREDDTLVQINNFDLMTPWNLSEAKRLYKEGEYTEAASQKLSNNSRVGTDFCPKKGDIVNVVLDIIATKNQPNGVLLIKAIMPLETKKASAVSFGFDDETEEVNLATEKAVEEPALT